MIPLRTMLVLLLALSHLGCDGPRERMADHPAPDADVPGGRQALPICLSGEPFVGEGAVPLQDRLAGDADEVTDLRWESYEGCERLVVELAAEGSDPATTVGEVDVEVIRDLGVVRIALRDVERVDPDATDATFGGPLARAAYSVWSPDGRWTWIDLHLGEAAEAHAMILDNPARVVVDLRPGGGGMPTPPATGQRVVVLRPRPGTASYPITVTGYARTFEANVVARIEQDGQDVTERFTTATAWVDAWGHYSMTIEDGPVGPIRLHVGEHSARDGRWDGVDVELEMR